MNNVVFVPSAGRRDVVVGSRGSVVLKKFPFCCLIPWKKGFKCHTPHPQSHPVGASCSSHRLLSAQPQNSQQPPRIALEMVVAFKSTLSQNSMGDFAAFSLDENELQFYFLLKIPPCYCADFHTPHDPSLSRHKERKPGSIWKNYQNNKRRNIFFSFCLDSGTLIGDVYGLVFSCKHYI